MKRIYNLIILLTITLSLSAQVDLRIVSIDPSIGEVTIKNFGPTMEDVSTYWLCNWPAYVNIGTLTAVDGNKLLLENASVRLSWASIIDSDGECGLYNTNSFGSASAIEDYVEWTSTGHFRSGLAVGENLWNAGDFIPNDPPYEFIGTSADVGSAFWTSQIFGCTYEPALNYNALANSDDGSCQFEEPCLGDLNNDEIITVADLLALLAVFGESCAP